MDPLFGSLYVDVPQTGVAVRRIQSDGKFVALKMVPKLVVRSRPASTRRSFRAT